MSLKLDMSKAYDRIEQGFLEKVKKKMGLGEQLVNLIMLCTKPVSFSILVNEEPKGPIYPIRGLRQGDLISSYLFLLCTEGLISLMQQTEVYKQIDGIKICKEAPKINHILFSNDSVLFCRVNMQTNLDIQHLLEVYEKISGQKMNREKTYMVFSKNVPNNQQDVIMAFWGVKNYQQYEKYLRLSPTFGKGKKKVFF